MIARARPSGPARRILPPEYVAELDREFEQAKSDAAFMERWLKDPPPTQEEIQELYDKHGPCPWEGPHTDNCNMMECVMALAQKRKEEAER